MCSLDDLFCLHSKYNNFDQRLYLYCKNTNVIWKSKSFNKKTDFSYIKWFNYNFSNDFSKPLLNNKSYSLYFYFDLILVCNAEAILMHYFTQNNLPN